MKRGAWAGLAVVLLACTVGEPVRNGAPGPPAPPAPDGPVERGGITAAEAAAAADLLARAQLSYEAAELEEALEAAERVRTEYAAAPAAEGAAWVAARAAFGLGDYARARELAAAYAAAQRSGSTQAREGEMLADLAADMLRPAGPPALIGVVLPRTGSRVLVRYGDWVLEGVELAARAFQERFGRRIDVVVADDAGGTRTEEAVAELERQGAIGVIGPLLPQQMSAAARARADDRLVLVSPTVPEAPLDLPDVYTVNAGDTRGAQELGRYAAEAGFTQAAVLYPRMADHQRKAQAFSLEFEDAGGVVRAVVAYDSGTTTFEPQLRRILESVAPRPAAVEWGPVDPPADSAAGLEGHAPGWGREPFALFVSAPERDVRQIAPQIAFYGLDAAGAQVFGDEAWASGNLRRLVPPRDLEGVLAAAHHDPERANGVADPDFVRRYETTYRRSLENQLPALGHDAANLMLQALPNRMLTPAALAFRMRLLSGIAGATGRLSVRGQRIVRTPVLVQIRSGELRPAPPARSYILPVPADSIPGPGPR